MAAKNFAWVAELGKCGRLKTSWLSAYAGSNPAPCINFYDHVKLVQNSEKALRNRWFLLMNSVHDSLSSLEQSSRLTKTPCYARSLWLFIYIFSMPHFQNIYLFFLF